MGKRWKTRLNRLVGYMSNNPNVQKDFRPFLRDSERWLEAAMGQLAGASGGMCGPIESQALASAAWQLAYARFWQWKLAEDPMNAKYVEASSRLADAARQNALAAYNLAVQLFRHQPQAQGDPLAAFEAMLADATPQDLSENSVPKEDPPTPSNVTLEND